MRLPILTVLLFCCMAIPMSQAKTVKCADSLVKCANVKCEDGAVLETPEGKCCPECVPRKVSTASTPGGNGSQATCCPPSCPTLTCPGGVEHVPQGECCPVCGPECTGVTCPNVDCSNGHWIQFPEYCCPICFTPATSTTVSPVTVAGTSPMTAAATTACPELDCDIGLAFPADKPCPECAEAVTRPDCGGVTCPPLDCPGGGQGSTLPEYCCPVCVSTSLPEPPQDCTEPCDPLSCKYGVYRPALACCNACIPGPQDPPAYCQTISCPFVDCVGGFPTSSPGECCVACAMP